MTNINSARGFIALTITLIILLLVISVSIMTGKIDLRGWQPPQREVAA